MHRIAKMIVSGATPRSWPLARTVTVAPIITSPIANDDGRRMLRMKNPIPPRSCVRRRIVNTDSSAS